MTENLRSSNEKNNFIKQITHAAKILRECAAREQFIRIVSHLDADGICAASILGQTLRRVNTSFGIRIWKQFDEHAVQELATDHSLIVFTDLGSGNLDLIQTNLKNNNILVFDHHEPQDISISNLCHVNPHLYGYNGSRDISGAGVTYLVSKAIDDFNIDLAALAVVGALGDAQDKTPQKKLIEFNEKIVNDAITAGSLHVEKDLVFFGRETKPVHKAIAHTTDPYIPGLTGEEDKCLGFLVNLGITLKNNSRWRAINDLSQSEKQMIFSEIAKYLSTRDIPDAAVMSMIGTTYTLIKEERGTPLRDAREFASLLNACGKMEKSGIGVSIGIGDRSFALEEAQTLLLEYKKALSKHLDWIKNNPDTIEHLENINFLDASGIIDELMISTIASILTSSNFFDDNKPLIAATITKDGSIKVSGRNPDSLRGNSVNLGELFHKVSSELNGRGGGHDAAAGAQLPHGIKEQFIQLINQEIGLTAREKKSQIH
ncbi:MAG: DHH family phosphoesterase [Candidatus Bathyarchaeota archaeon]|nr:MAG: DHH family phosphoesterase [Candidatus Bathyarchaeota archaeon]